ncbi:MAG: sigma-70 family RNA polymerase sigma factor [Pirellulaceae bacterium]|nr:sigma-70 family RNA polymerase sigma factor [Pirellulaceae bacterium]
MPSERTLQELVEATRSEDPGVAADAQAALYACTLRFVYLVVREARGQAWRVHASTEWLANAAEKSFLSYVRKTQWQAGLPEDRTLLAMLRTITRRVVIREINKLVGEPRQAELDFDQVLRDCGSHDGQGARRADFQDFMEHLLARLGDSDQDSVRVLELALEGHTRREIGEMLNIGRGRMHRLMVALRRDVLLCLLEQEQPDVARAFRMHETGATPPQIAEQTGSDPDWVRQAVENVGRLLGRPGDAP